MTKIEHKSGADRPIECNAPMLSDLAASTLGSLTPDTLVRDVSRLPSAPRLLPQLARLLGAGNSSLQDVLRLIRLDPAIAAGVLQMANRAHYSHGVSVHSVDEAIYQVGFDDVYKLVAHAVAAQALVRPLQTYTLPADDLWRRSVACALAAEMLAERTGQNPETGYTIGLLHALGMIAIDGWAVRHQPELRLSSKGFPQETSESERLCLGFTHADVGAALLHQWKFPRGMCDPVRYQYTPRACASQPRLACVLHAAKWLCAVVCGPADERPPLPARAILQMLTVPAGTLPALKVELESRLRQVNSILDVDPPSTIDVPLRFSNRARASA